MSLIIEHLSPRDSQFARFDARWRLAALVLAAAAVVVMRKESVQAAALVISVALAWAARVPWKWYRARIGVLLIALGPFLVILPLTVDRGGPALDFSGIRLSQDGFLVACGLMCKTTAIVTLMLILIASAPLHVSLRAAQSLYVPALFVHLAMMSYRYIFLLLDELQRLRIAVRVRGFRNRANRHSYRTIGHVTGTLLVRSLERAERVTQAMRCRGFDGTFRLTQNFRTRAQDVLLFGMIVVIYSGLLVWDILS